MNRTFKVIFNQVLGRHVVVSEIASSIQRGARKAVMAVAAGGALATAALLPMGEAGAISSSYVPSYSSQYGSSVPADYQTDGGHVDVNQIGGRDPQTGNWYSYVYVNNDGTINFYKNENYQQNDISSMVGNVAIGNFSQAGSAADAKMVGFYNSSMNLAYETKPEGATGTWYQTSAPDGKLYWYQSSWNNRTYAYSPTYYSGGSIIEKDGKYYQSRQDFEPELDGEGNWQYDDNGNPIGKTVTKFAEIGDKSGSRIRTIPLAIFSSITKRSMSMDNRSLT